MPNRDLTKLRVLYTAQLLRDETDEGHGLTLAELSDRLEALGVGAERKALYRDLDALKAFGMDIIAERSGGTTRYFLGARTFELAELKLLVDAVQGAKFITEAKSRALIKKLETLLSRHDAKHLHRQVMISGRVKTMNESVYYNVDRLHEAIGADRAIRFQYFQWNVRGEAELRRGGAWYRVSPWCLMWEDENYYLVAYDPADGQIRHYRVDKMLRISGTPERRAGREAFEAFNAPRYAKQVFGMFGGEPRRVTLRCENRFAGVMIDRFGKDAPLHPDGPEHFTLSVEVAVSPQFFGWVAGLGSGVVLTAPDDVVREMKRLAAELCACYRPEERGEDGL